MLNSHKCSTSIHVLKAVAIVTSVHLKYTISIIYVASHFLSVKVSPERRLKVKLLVNFHLFHFCGFFFQACHNLHMYTYPVTKYNLHMYTLSFFCIQTYIHVAEGDCVKASLLSFTKLVSNAFPLLGSNNTSVSQMLGWLTMKFAGKSNAMVRARS